MTMSNLGCNDYEQNEIVQNCNFLDISALLVRDDFTHNDYEQSHELFCHPFSMYLRGTFLQVFISLPQEHRTRKHCSGRFGSFNTPMSRS